MIMIGLRIIMLDIEKERSNTSNMIVKIVMGLSRWLEMYILLKNGLEKL